VFKEPFQQQYTFHQFPLDCHNVNYQIEDNIYGRSYLIYKKDDLLAQIFGQTFGTAGIKNGTTIPGWEIGTTLLQKEAVANYNTTDFLQAYANTAFSNYRFGVTITRGLDVYTLKVIPPVFFAIFTGFLLFLFDADLMGTRIQSMAGVIVGIIFLQLFFDSGVPSGDYLTLVDWLFNLTYLMSVVSLTECIVIYDYYQGALGAADDINDEMALMKLRKIDDAPLSSFLKPPEKRDEEEKPEANPNRILNSLASVRQLGEYFPTAKQAKKAKKEEKKYPYAHLKTMKLTEQLRILSEKSKKKREKVKNYVAYIEKIVFGVIVSFYILFVIIMSSAIGAASSDDAF